MALMHYGTFALCTLRTGTLTGCEMMAKFLLRATSARICASSAAVASSADLPLLLLLLLLVVASLSLAPSGACCSAGSGAAAAAEAGECTAAARVTPTLLAAGGGGLHLSGGGWAVMPLALQFRPALPAWREGSVWREGMLLSCHSGLGLCQGMVAGVLRACGVWCMCACVCVCVCLGLHAQCWLVRVLGP